jgi:hypothetical protein
VRPQNGAIMVNTAAWSATTRAWSERSSSTTGAVAHQLGALAPDACYAVSANSRTVGNYRADSTGHIAFGYAGGYGAPVQFRAAPAPCAGGAPTQSVFLPLIKH